MQRVLLIGGTSGIGLAIRNELYGAEMQICSVSRSTTPSLDLRSDNIRQRTKEIVTGLGGLDYLIVSSGMGAYLGPLPDSKSVDELFQVNVLGPMEVYRGALKALLKSRGKAIFITSIAGRRPGSGGLSVYGSTKAALNAWIIGEGRRAAGAEVALCAVAPGFIETEMTENMVPEVKEAATKAIPFGRFGEAHEVAQFVVSLMKQPNWCLAGQVFEISGAA